MISSTTTMDIMAIVIGKPSDSGSNAFAKLFWPSPFLVVCPCGVMVGKGSTVVVFSAVVLLAVVVVFSVVAVVVDLVGLGFVGVVVDSGQELSSSPHFPHLFLVASPPQTSLQSTQLIQFPLQSLSGVEYRHRFGSFTLCPLK